ncbi:hypothetical protein EBL_c20710 [Shimwellia blattae DSM 4481 = NBRC 105725]|uniref:Uncharacterized protein n=1 Tax=Shimwellia blattae (strain ATCC 29907 / DSM 4481 / JCM 1650 / NBRC 105725 / CDC 9005-74) TaxID=630626 RepID=I2B9F8_SHIBC|nr:hypothetical protein [Shimwellia blattae]AFJ47162.1 hypothetical protein EBL_c20710 [Shimwellia blattae DSM 4481 = NBRC 105725]GAB80718.1 hypothetical protein EB105725_08_00020 [Shimwellia blattae DSM 4481 = NBRC 105725]VDY64654.1 Uncharacterised protein [Shimwellia blattae]VEC22761.1 Uncharacterised protein [Shimwellia blattae]
MVNKPQPYFYNPGMSSTQLENWLGQQKIHLSRYNSLLKEKAALEERLQCILAEITVMANCEGEGKLNFPWEPSP